MASNTARIPLLQILGRRRFGSKAAEKAVTCATSDIMVTTLPNKMVIASADCHNLGVVQVCVAVKAGSRYETPDNYGASHVLRSSAGLSTGSASKFAIIRNLQQRGSTLMATSDRETIIYTLETTCNHLLPCLDFLKAVTTEQCFKPWELAENVSRIKYELGLVPNRAKLLDDLHKAAYRTGLGNSMFVKDYNIRKMDQETLQHFVNSTFLSGRTAVAGIGVEHGTLEEFAQCLKMHDTSGESKAAKYYGGEVRHEANTDLTHVAYAAEASGLNKKEVFAYAVLSHTLGGGSPAVKWGTGAGPLTCAIQSVNVHPVAAQAFTSVHSDSGLFGFIVSAPPEAIGKAVIAALGAVKGCIKEEDFKRGKEQLKAELLYNAEACQNLRLELVTQALLLGGAKTPKQLVDAVDQVTFTQVQEALGKVESGKKSMASIGKLHNVPYLQDLS